jgi:hypothetical protein
LSRPTFGCPFLSSFGALPGFPDVAFGVAFSALAEAAVDPVAAEPAERPPSLGERPALPLGSEAFVGLLRAMPPG